jgi:proline dehydrogenase
VRSDCHTRAYHPQRMRVELLTTADCPHVELAEEEIRSALSAINGATTVERVYVSDLDNAAGLGFHGSPTIRIDDLEIMAAGPRPPIGLECRLYEQPDGRLAAYVPAEAIVAELERRREAEAEARAARTSLRSLPARLSRGFFLWASRRRSLARLATAIPFTRAMVRRFVAGDRLDDALAVLEGLREHGLTWTVDVLGESVSSREMAVASADSYVETLDALAARGLEANVSLKLTQMGLDIDRGLCVENVGRVVERARQIGAFVRIDMEDHTKTQVTLDIVRELHERHSEVGAVIQSYLRRSEADIEMLNRHRIRVRLCKGAYDEPVTVAHRAKEDVDRSYMELTEQLLLEGRYPALATHDEAMIEHALSVAERNGIAPDRYEFQMLYGVRRDLQERLISIGQTVRVYVPYGTQWYPYYMRRLAERPANVLFILGSVLREGRGGGAS